MRKREPGGVQELALEAEAGNAVDRVADDGQVDGREVDSDLVRAAGLEPDAEQRVLGEQLDDLEVRDRLVWRVGVQRLPRRLRPVAADRRLDPPCTRTRPPADERQVLALQPVPADERLQPAMRLLRPRHDQQPGSVAVEPVHDSRPLRLPAGRLAEERVDERPGLSPRAGMDDEPRRLVHDQQVLVLEGDPEVERLRDESLDDGRLELDLLALDEAERLLARRPVDPYVTCGEQPLRRGA